MLFYIALVVSLLWIPVFLRFFFNWRQRRNPVSLAICSQVAIVGYLNIACPLFFDAGYFWTHVTIAMLNFVGSLLFYISFWLAKKNFRDQRVPSL